MAGTRPSSVALPFNAAPNHVALAALLAACPVYRATPFTAQPALAAALGVASVLLKDESQRPLGSFKALGGVYAGLNALARAIGVGVHDLLDPGHRAGRPADLPTLICASDGNHGLAVAAAAALAGTTARVYLPAIVPEARIARIAAKGAAIRRIAGTYDAAVHAAAAAAHAGEGLLVADTGEDPDDPVVRDVMAGYGVIAAEIRAQHAGPKSTHLFVQAGVGGLAAALAEGLHAMLAPPARIVVVEPTAAACVAAALEAGHVVTVPGALDTAAEMLSCGEASAPALAILRGCRATAIAVPEDALQAAPGFLAAQGGPATTPSGAAGLAGLRIARADSGLAARLGVDATSRVLIIVTEGVPA